MLCVSRQIRSSGGSVGFAPDLNKGAKGKEIHVPAEREGAGEEVVAAGNSPWSATGITAATPASNNHPLYILEKPENPHLEQQVTSIVL